MRCGSRAAENGGSSDDVEDDRSRVGTQWMRGETSQDVAEQG